QKAARERMVRVTAQLGGPAVFDGHEHAAGVRAIVRADEFERPGVAVFHGIASAAIIRAPSLSQQTDRRHRSHPLTTCFIMRQSQACNRSLFLRNLMTPHPARRRFSPSWLLICVSLLVPFSLINLSAGAQDKKDDKKADKKDDKKVDKKDD